MCGSLKLCVFFICVVVTVVPAQTEPLQDEVAQLRRVTALALITSLAEEARDYRDEALRVRIQARAAEAIWKTDQARALSLFQRAWESADVIDRAAEQRNEDDRRMFVSGQNKIGFIAPPKKLRLEVLRFAARCNRELAEKFLAQLEEEKKQTDNEAAANTDPFAAWDPTEPPPGINRRLELANLLLDAGEVEKALRIADPALEHVTKPGIVFLYKLRQRNSSAADQRFSAQLMRSAVDPLADANSISLLSTYAFTPLVFATVTRNGRAFGGDPGPIPELSRDLHAAFFKVAAQVLLRPLTAREQDQTSAGREGRYFVIARLLPLFEKHAPEKVPELNAYLTTLTPDTPESLRNNYMMRTAGFNQEAPAMDDIELVLKQAQRVSNSGERDRLYLNAIHRFLKLNPPRAREVAEKIENVDLRKSVFALIDLVLLQAAVQAQNTEAILRLVRSGTLPSIQRVWGYTEAARLLKSDPIAALQILAEAAAEARRIDQSNPERVQALIAIATSSLDIDRAQAWENMSEVVKAANHTADFQGEAGKVTAHLGTGNMVTTLDVEVPGFDLAGIFSSLAREDLQRAIDLAKSFPATESRAIAIFAIARSVLEEKASKTVKR